MVAILALTYFFSYLEPVCCSMSSSNCCFLICIQTSPEAGQVVWYFHLLKNFPQCVVIHTVKGFSIVHEVEVGVFLEISCLFYDPVDVGTLISGSSVFSKSSMYVWKFSVHVLFQCSVSSLFHFEESQGYYTMLFQIELLNSIC